MAKSHPEEGRYLCRFYPCNEILVRLDEIFETGKKQDLTPLIGALFGELRKCYYEERKNAGC